MNSADKTMEMDTFSLVFLHFDVPETCIVTVNKMISRRTVLDIPKFIFCGDIFLLDHAGSPRYHCL